ncbi:MAG: ATP-dependent DNA helicase [Faecalibacterium sp.]
MSQIRLAVRQLVEFLLRTGDIDSRFSGFDRANEGARIHRRLQKQGGEGYEAEVFLSASRTVEGICFTVEGRADGIFTDADGTVVIDEIKTTTLPADQITEDREPCHWAQGMVYGAIYAHEKGLDALAVRLTYFQTEEETIFRFVRRFSRAELEDFLLGLLRQYAPWAQRQMEWEKRRAQSLGVLRFPFAGYRPGQRALAGEVYRACRSGRNEGRKGGTRVFCQAPTGIGKTMSALFPALKAIGEGYGEKLFYLTARNTTQAAAEDALARLRVAAPELALRSVTLTAKDKACLCKDEAGRPACLPERCPYARGYYDRLKPALAALLDSPGCFDRAALAGAAGQFMVCPFELGLDLSEWCDVVIGDYNYLFDPVVRLRRFFDAAGDWLFLIDEAHNLPDRARTMYSAQFCKSSLLEGKRALGRGRSALKAALTRADKALLEARRACLRLAPWRGPDAEEAEKEEAVQTALFDLCAETSEEENTAASVLPEPLYAKEGTVFFKELPAALLRPLHALISPLQDWLDENQEDERHSVLLELFFAVQGFVRAAERYDSHFVTQLTAHGSELEVSLLCLDPSAFVDASLSCGRAAALFSATLTPPSYYRGVLGCPEARAVALESPFPPEHLGLYCLPSISTRYRDRERSVQPISDALAALARGKVGNYLAFFPSYSYLRQVYEDFTARWPDIAALAQESGLDDAGRAAFLGQFVPHPRQTLLGFGVLGGVFGEGVDLTGDRLIGCAVVGVGLPQVNPRQEMLRRYYDETAGCGFNYAYRYPGMNKVLQAAGRVIRTPEDRGVVLLLDDRFSHADYMRLFPRHWAHLKFLPDAQALGQELRGFWEEG